MTRLCQPIFSGALLLIGCLCFSQAKAPQDPFERLYFDSPLLIGSSKAWIVQEPRVISTGRVLRMMFGPGPDEAVVISVPRETVTAKQAVGSEDDSEPVKDYRILVASLSTGASQLRGKFQSRSLHAQWASQGRLMLVSLDEGEGILDLNSGSFFLLPKDKMDLPVISQIPHIALLREYDWPRPADQGSTSAGIWMRLIDFSINPPRTEAIQLPPHATDPICLSRSGLLITHSGGINIRTGEVRKLADSEIADFIAAVSERRKAVEVESSVDYKGISLIVQEQDAKVKSGTKPAMRPRMVISEEAWHGEVSDSEKWVLFQAHGVGFAVQLTPIDLEAALRALMKSAKKNALSFAKQSATATHIYSADYDSCLPISGARARDALMPYIHSAAIVDSVVWTNLTGQNLEKLDSPAQTVLGYVPGPGGRAVIYADSHVVWVPD